MTIAVTAASGRLGTALLRELAAAGPPGGLVAVARDPARLSLPAPGLVARAGDYESVASMTAGLAGADTVVMISAPVAGGSERQRLHRNVIAAARAAGARTVVYTSVVGNGREAGTLFEPTQRVNRQAEADLRDSGLGWVVLRNGLYLELDLAHIIAADAEGGVYTNPGGEGRAPYITIDEIAVATAAVARRARTLEGRTLNVVAQCHTQGELVAMANEVFGLRVRYETISDEACIAKFSRLMAHRGEAVARMLTGCFQCIRAGAFDVPSDFAEAAGRPPPGVRQMMEDVKRRRAAAAGV